MPAGGLAAPGAKILEPQLFQTVGKQVAFGYDVPGLIWWALSRREEVGRTDLDRYGRFSATASHAFRHGYLNRPIVDEWLEVVGQALQRIWPRLLPQERAFQMRVSHDVDIPSQYGLRSGRAFIRAVAVDVIRHRRYGDALWSPLFRLAARKQIHDRDPANTFDWLMSCSERHGLQSAFYFICGRTNPEMDAGYEIDSSTMRRLLRRIHRRGHEIGLHPSFNTFLDSSALVREAGRLRTVCDDEGIRQALWGGRMHYLRWRTPLTARAWEAAGMDYDSTLGYADHVGFRCGTCVEFQAFDPVQDRALNLRIRPLVAMEASVISEAYMGLGTTQAALDVLVALKNRCRAVRGTFTLLWHNSELRSAEARSLYMDVLAS